MMTFDAKGRISCADDLPKSIPMTGPLIFLSPPSELYRTKEDPNGARIEDRVAEEVALGS
jgi:hypothetical protein